MDSFVSMVKNYTKFSGRTSRKDFWMAYLFYLIFCIPVGIVGGILTAITGIETISSVVSGIYGLAFMIPMLAMEIRRLHDIGKSGWWFFISFVPCIGWIWLIVLLATPGVQGPNEYDE